MNKKDKEQEAAREARIKAVEELAERYDESDFDPAEVEMLSEEMTAKINQGIDDALGMNLISFRVDKTLFVELEKLAKRRGNSWQYLARTIISDYVRSQTQSD